MTGTSHLVLVMAELLSDIFFSRGFRYWRTEPFNSDYLNLQPGSKARFLGFWAVFTQAAFSCTHFFASRWTYILNLLSQTVVWRVLP